MTCTMKKSLSFLVLFLMFFRICSANIYPWTDLNGRTLQAKFLEASGSSVTIEVNGQPFDIALDSLSPESRALATLLQTQQKKPAVKQYDWTDTSGRTIRAGFVKSTPQSVTLDVNGNQTTLPLSMFNDASQALAEKLGGSLPSQGNQPQPPSLTPVSEPTSAVDLTGKLDLSLEYPWSNQAGQTVQGKFIELTSESLKISTFAGRREVVIPTKSLSSQSLGLAKKLNALSIAEVKNLSVMAKKRKTMKVPSLQETDLEIEHALTNTKGQTVNAKFAGSNDRAVSLFLSGRPNAIELPWNTFSDESVGILEALRRLRAQVDARKPKIVPGKKNSLSSYSTGKYKGYHAIIEEEGFIVAVRRSGNGLEIFRNLGQTETSASSLGTARIAVNFGTYYRDKSDPDPKRHRTRSRAIKSFDTYRDPSMDPQLLELSGTYTNGGTFEYNIELKKTGVSLWSKMKDPSGEKWPSYHRINIGVRGVVPNAINMTMPQINAAVGNGTFEFQAVGGKPVKVPMNMKWTDVRKKMKINTNNLQSFSVYGKPYDPFKATVTSASIKGMSLDMDKSYAKTFPLQGVSYEYRSLEERNRKQIPKSNALKIILSSK